MVERRWEEEQQLPASSPGFSCWSAFSLTSDNIRSVQDFLPELLYLRTSAPTFATTYRICSLFFVQILRLANALKSIFLGISTLHGVIIRLIFIGPLALFLRYLVQMLCLADLVLDPVSGFHALHFFQEKFPILQREHLDFQA
jgi:hypothetical protein